MASSIWRQFVWERKTLKQLCKEHGRGQSWVRKQLSDAVVNFTPVPPCETVIIADTTWFKKAFKFCVIRSSHLKKNLFWLETDTENAEIYRRVKEAVESLGFVITGAVLDGKRGIRGVFEGIPVQMCHFHQQAIITRKLTNRPKLTAGIELKALSRKLCSSSKANFSTLLSAWHTRWGDFIKERTVNKDTGRWHYTHKRLRSAYFSLKNNLPYLFTYEDYPSLKIPNTTNSLDGSFAQLKELVLIHRGLNKGLKKKMIDEILGKKP
jgi:hypothetical protein